MLSFAFKLCYFLCLLVNISLFVRILDFHFCPEVLQSLIEPPNHKPISPVGWEFFFLFISFYWITGSCDSLSDCVLCIFFVPSVSTLDEIVSLRSSGLIVIDQIGVAYCLRSIQKLA